MSALLFLLASQAVPPPPPPYPPTLPGHVCTNGCSLALDGICDDGGLGAEYSFCSLGTDCDDCGSRAAPPPHPPYLPGHVCTNGCSLARDGDCDDGGLGAEFSICFLGTDCDDCGSRAAPPPPRPHPPSPPTLPGHVCTNGCSLARDGDCDDGGLGAEFSYCSLGTDCDDCGSRAAPHAPPPRPPYLPGHVCTNGCVFHVHNGVCEDGGLGAEFYSCSRGTDCDDCGSRVAPPPLPPHPPNPPTLPGHVCNNECNAAFDGVCEDGGEGSERTVCSFGTDCDDCGSRVAPPPRPPNLFGHGAPQQTPQISRCDDTCIYSADGECDDGGPGAEYYTCSFGTDCTDCELRGTGSALFSTLSKYKLHPSPPRQRSASFETSPFCRVYDEERCASDLSDYCCDDECSHCGPLVYCTALSPFRAISDICTQQTVCGNLYHLCKLPPPFAPFASPASPVRTLTANSVDSGHVRVSIVASGTVNDYKNLTVLQIKLASIAGLSASNVEISVTAASVKIVAIIIIPSTASLSVVLSLIQDSIGTAELASAALLIPVVSIQIQTTIDQNTNDATPVGMIVGLCGGAAALFICYLRVRKRRSVKPDGDARQSQSAAATSGMTTELGAISTTTS